MACHPGWKRTRDNSLRLRDLELWLVWKGRGWMRNAEREFVLFPGFCALMRPGGIYDAWQDEAYPLGITYIHFEVRASKRGQPLIPREWAEFFEVDDLEFYDSATRRVLQLAGVAPEVAEVLLKGIVADLLRLPPPREPGSGEPRWARRIARLVASVHASHARLPEVAEMAAELHLSQAHFSRIFKAETGQSPRDFLIETRLSRARHLLAETNLTVGEIAEQLHYADIFFFSRQFRGKTGISPLEYRRHAAHPPR